MNKSTKEKLYQMFILGLEGETLSGNPNLKAALQKGLGGVIFFTQNIKTEKQFKNLINEIKKEALIFPFLSIDQEGGRVERTENIHDGKKYLSPKYAAQKGEEFLKNQTEQIACELKDFGINLNFAPCVDVNTNPDNPIIGERAFSDKTDEVIKFGKTVSQEYLKNGIIPCLKHYPGHGDTNQDSHLTLPEINLPLEEMEKIHIKPFKEISAPMIMAAHLHCACFDKEKIPTSLGKNAIGYLRKNLGFEGVIITDDMVMQGALGFESTKACEMAIKAGVNILLYRNSFDETIQIIENLAQKALLDKELKENIEISFEKIMKLKIKN
ncbi:MAG TPA: glycoside hydrolase family 3 N-terminal domain-containing protein [Candidatus Gastranaerophilaceae bacterium]|nr:glycoside hydrolase family 3 N-terminal domain-containing protein [Candidatus Gastranaerophilaceae bacterium]